MVPKHVKRFSSAFFLFVVLTLINVSLVFASFGYGDQGQEVTDIQNRLVQLHYDVGGVDGVFGHGTETAVKSYQRDNNLESDGVVGAQTYRALMNREMPVNRSGNSAAIRTVLRTAYNMRGVPYVFGGTSPYGFDCSGFTQYAFSAAGYNLPRMADSQYYAFRKVSSGNLQPGYLVFFSTYEYGPSHVGIYLGDGNFINASSSRGVAVDSLNSSYWGSCYIGARRVM